MTILLFIVHRWMKFCFGEVELNSFIKLKESLSSPILRFYDPAKKIFLCTDASLVMIGVVLMQESPEGR